MIGVAQRICGNQSVYSNTESLSFSAAVSDGSLIVAVVLSGNPNITLSNVQDNLNTGLYAYAGYRLSTLGNVYVMYFPASVPGSITVTANLSDNSSSAEMFLYEITGATTTPVDITNSNFSTSITVDSGSITTTHNHEILLGAVLTQGDIVSGAWSTLINPNTTNATQYLATSSTGTYKSLFTNSSRTSWCSVIVSFKQATLTMNMYGSCVAKAYSTGVLTNYLALASNCTSTSAGLSSLSVSPVFLAGVCAAVTVCAATMISGQPLIGTCVTVAVNSGYLESRLEYAVLSVDRTMVRYATFWDYRELHVFYQNSGGCPVYPVTMTAQPAFDPMTQYVLQRGWQINANDVTPIWVIFQQTPEQLVVTNAQAFYNSVTALGLVDLFNACDGAWTNQSSSQLLVTGTIHLAGICVARAEVQLPPDKDLVLRRVMEAVNAILQCKFAQQH